MAEDPLRNYKEMTFAGVRALQLWVDFFLWERLLNVLPETKAVLELGTDQGGFSLYLQCQCDLRGIEFHTFDSIVPANVEKLHNFHKMHLFLEHKELVEIMHSFDGPIILFCDNGNKPRELDMFSNKMPPGSVVAVHDWGTETLPEHVPNWLQEIMGDFCDLLGSATRLFVPKEEE